MRATPPSLFAAQVSHAWAALFLTPNRSLSQQSRVSRNLRFSLFGSLLTLLDYYCQKCDTNKMGLLNWLTRKVIARIPPAQAAPPRVSLDTAIETLLVKAVQANGDAAASRMMADTEFLKAIADIKAKSAAQLLGSKGGNERVRRMRERAAKLDPQWCPVCKHDNQRSSKPIIQWHMRGHAGARPAMGVVNNVQPRQAEEHPGQQPDGEVRSDKQSGA